MVWNVVENHVVTLPTFGEILFCVIDDTICAERSHKIDISGAAYAGHVCAERFRDLDGECSHASGSAVNQDLLAGLNFSAVAKRLQRRDAGDVDRSRLLKCDVCRFNRNGSNRARINILAKAPASPAEHFIAWFELR